jgi:hypothetical protein
VTPGQKRQSARRASFVVVFGEGEKRWSMADPGHPTVDAAQHETRYGCIDQLAKAKAYEPAKKAKRAP